MLLIALLVIASLYLLVFERDTVIALAGNNPRTADAPDPAETVASEEPAQAPIAVVALRSQARQIDCAVLLRGRTDADRQVEVRAETSSKVISAPLRKGPSVEEGQLLCRLDSGARKVALIEAEARLTDALINQRAAERLSEGGYASDTRVAAMRAEVQSALASVETEARRRPVVGGIDRRGRDRA